MMNFSFQLFFEDWISLYKILIKDIKSGQDITLQYQNQCLPHNIIITNILKRENIDANEM